MIKMNHDGYRVQARISPWLVLFMFILLCPAKAQYEKPMNNYQGIVSVLAETYDGALLIEADPNTFSGPVLLIKYTLEGKELWRKQFDNTFWITGATATSDSGFIVAAIVEPAHVDSAAFDTSGDIALIKFDKCAKMQWARFIPTPGYNSPTNVIENNHDYYLVGMEIGSPDQNHRKPATILKFSPSGELLNYKSFEGNYTLLYNNFNADTIYFSQDLSIPILGGDTGNYYIFSGIQSLDTNLNIINKAVMGYQQTILSQCGPLIINKNGIKLLAQRRFLTNEASDVMFTDLNKSLAISSFHYDSLPNWNFYPLAASFYHDTLLTCNQLVDSTGREYVSMRQYDNNYKMIKEAVINDHNYQQVPFSFLGLANNDCVVNTENYNSYSSSFYLFDNKLNPLPWPTVSPARGYDWACTSAIPAFEEINLDSVVQPVFVKPDTSRPNWQWLGIKEPVNPVIGNKDNGWFLWPEPVSHGGELDFRSVVLSREINSYQDINVCFYDCQGKKTAIMTAIPQGIGQWTIPYLKLSVPGLYVAVLSSNQTGSMIGSFKVILK